MLAQGIHLLKNSKDRGKTGYIYHFGQKRKRGGGGSEISKEVGNLLVVEEEPPRNNETRPRE